MDNFRKIKNIRTCNKCNLPFEAKTGFRCYKCNKKYCYNQRCSNTTYNLMHCDWCYYETHATQIELVHLTPRIMEQSEISEISYLYTMHLAAQGTEQEEFYTSTYYKKAKELVFRVEWMKIQKELFH